MRPPDLLRLIVNVVGLRDAWDTAVSVGRHAAGRVTEEEATFIPEPERHKVYREARAWIAVYAVVVAARDRPALAAAAHVCGAADAVWPLAVDAVRDLPARRAWPRTSSTTA